MATIKYTHSYDLFWQIFSLVVGIGTGMVIGALLADIGLSAPYYAVVGIVVSGGIILFCSSLPFPTYWYIRFELQTKVSLRDARKLEDIFFTLEPGKWLPHREVLQVPSGQRREYLFSILGQHRSLYDLERLIAPLREASSLVQAQRPQSQMPERPPPVVEPPAPPAHPKSQPEEAPAYRLKIHNQIQGPYTWTEILARLGHLPEDTMIWHPGTNEWRPARETPLI